MNAEDKLIKEFLEIIESMDEEEVIVPIKKVETTLVTIDDRTIWVEELYQVSNSGDYVLVSGERMAFVTREKVEPTPYLNRFCAEHLNKHFYDIEQIKGSLSVLGR